MEMDKSYLLFIAHGSKNAKWNESIERLVLNLNKSFGGGIVYLAYLKNLEAVLEDLSLEAIKNEIPKINILPLFISSGEHIENDIPQEVKKITSKFPDLNIEVHQPIGEHPKLLNVIKEIAREYLELKMTR